MKEELSIRDLISFIKKAVRLVFSYKWILLLFIILGVSFGVYKVKTGKVIYKAETSFIMDTGQGGGKASALMGLASQFGLGGGSSSGMTEDKLLAIAKSKAVISQALLTKSTINGKTDFNVNHYIDFTYAPLKEKGVEVLRFKHGLNEKPSYEEDSMMNKFFNAYTKNLLTFSKSKEGIIKVGFASENQPFTKQFIDDLTEAIIAFFTKQSVEKKRISADVMQYKCDSLYSALHYKEQQLAKVIDGTYNIVHMRGQLPEMELQREVRILNVMYSEALKNLEMVKFDLMYDAPVISIIDRPVLPLIKEEPSMMVWSAIGSFLGFMLGLIFIGARVFYKKYWKNA